MSSKYLLVEFEGEIFEGRVLTASLFAGAIVFKQSRWAGFTLSGFGFPGRFDLASTACSSTSCAVNSMSTATLLNWRGLAETAAYTPIGAYFVHCSDFPWR
jgi:hypothetical protein